MVKFLWIPLLILLQVATSEQSAFAADFGDANLSGAHLTNADLRGSNLSGANLTGADLSRTDLTGTNVTQLQLDSACGSGTRLPPGLRIQPCLASTASSGSDGTRPRTNAEMALPKTYDDRGPASGVLRGVLPMTMQTRATQQSSEREASSWAEAQ
jgi:hypothetical protein